MKKILLSIGILAIVGVVVAGATGAWFTNTETSTGNTFTAGVIDLRIDNDSYVTNNDGVLVASPSTSWEIKDLDKGELFFNFKDLKPGDIGEDTISIHVGSNDAWACMDINITATPENGQTEPEAQVDSTIGDDEGELQDELEFVFWKDDGDNVLEWDEVEVVEEEGKRGTFWNMTLQDISDSGILALADSQGGVLEYGSPLNGEETYYIGKAWCQGKLTLDPKDPYLPSDDVVYDNRGPLERDTGILCDGYPIGDASQTDGVMVDVSFTVEQSRHNENFLCNPPQQGQLTVVKVIEGGPISNPDYFDLMVDGNPIDSGDTITVSAETHTVSEDRESDYAVSFSDDCNSSGDVNVPANGSALCTITNTYTIGNLTIYKEVNGGPLANSPNSFNLMVGTEPVDNGVAESFQAGNYAVTEDTVTGYDASYGSNCSEGIVTVLANEIASCTITNTWTMGMLTIEKIVVGGPLAGNPNAFGGFDVSGEPVELGVAEAFPVNTTLYVNEDEGDLRYTATYSGACDVTNEVTLAVDEDATCTITNTYNRATLTVDKRIAFTSDAVAVVISDFALTISGPSGTIIVIDEVSETDLLPGTYTISEVKTGGAGTIADAEFDINCTEIGNTGEGTITLAAGDDLTCRITNNIAP